MGLLRTDRRILPLILALIVVLWAEGVVAMLPTGDYPAQCARAPHMQHAANSMPCCPPRPESCSTKSTPPSCCDLSNQPVPPLAFIVTPGKSRPDQISGSSTAYVMPLAHQKSFALLSSVSSPPFVKPVFDLKTDLRI
jgi:hypothetical protein